MPLLEIYTDGSCNPNPGTGAWSAIILLDRRSPLKLSGKHDWTTNNQMELTGILRALEWLKGNGLSEALIISDSQYALGCVKWAAGWEANGWAKVKKRDGPIKNLDLIQQIHAINRHLSVTWRWVRGHSGNYWNEIADKAAEETRRGMPLI